MISLENPVIASPQFKPNNQIELASTPDDNLVEQSQLDQSLAMVEQMDDSQLKVILLNDLALSYAELGNQEKAIAILEQSLSIAESFKDNIVLKITTITNIAKYYEQIGQTNRALEILADAVELASDVSNKSQQGQLLLDISFKYREIGEVETAQNLWLQSQTIMAEAAQPLPEFPFQEEPSDFRLGFVGNVNSFRDTTAFMGVDVDYYKQWSEDDIWVDAGLFVSFDSGRSVNNFRPQGLVYTVYRHHFNADWNFFTDFFNSTNQDLFSSKNDDEDLEIISSIYTGAALNLWRGDSPSQFLDFQMGIGSRYQYDYIAFEQRRNRMDPVLALILFGRGFSIGEVSIDQIFSVVPALDNFDDYTLTSDTKLSVPLSQRWSLINRVFVRYQNELVFEGSPKWQFFFSTGVEYKF